MKFMVGTLAIVLTAFSLRASEEIPFDTSATSRPIDNLEMTAEPVFENHDYTSYNYLKFGMYSFKPNEEIKSFENTPLYMSTGVGKRFLIGNHHGGSIEINGGVMPDYCSIATLKTGYSYKFYSGADAPSPYIGVSQNTGILRLNNSVISDYKKKFVKSLRKNINSTQIFSNPELVAGYEFRIAGKSPVFIELTKPLLDNSASFSMGIGF